MSLLCCISDLQNTRRQKFLQLIWRTTVEHPPPLKSKVKFSAGSSYSFSVPYLPLSTAADDSWTPASIPANYMSLIKWLCDRFGDSRFSYPAVIKGWSMYYYSFLYWLFFLPSKYNTTVSQTKFSALESIPPSSKSKDNVSCFSNNSICCILKFMVF